ncbi:MAG: transporter substrate-binding domain-containing protein, partial [Deltaproteobacteria bacterium]|nr:transporter substrate-binding domain-containing protein [Deltaproteobacteria bacterium]
MNLKKLTIVTIALLLFLIGCAQTNSNTAIASATPVIDRIQKSGMLTVGMTGNMPPLNMTSKEGELMGYEVDLARAMARAMGVKAQLKTMPFAELLPALEAGKIDMIISNMTITPGRNMKVAFVGPYFVSGKAFMTKKKTIALADEADDIDAKSTKLVALKGSTSQAFVETALPEAQLITAKDYDEAVKMVLEDKVHAMVSDYPIAVVSVYRYPEQGLLSVVTTLTYEPIGVGVPIGDPLLVNWVENFLGIAESTGLLDELKRKWLSNADWLNRL